MVRKIQLNTAEDLRQFMNYAWECEGDVGVHTVDGQIADAKSILGLMSLDYNEPVMVVTENEGFFKKLSQWLVD